MASLQKEIKISKSDFDILIGGGSITKGGITYTYDENALYLVDEDIKLAEWGKILGTISNLTDLQNVLNLKANTSDLATVATSGSYTDLSNTPTIPVVNDAALTIKKNGEAIASFTANASSAVDADIIVPTKTSDLINDSDFITSAYTYAKADIDQSEADLIRAINTRGLNDVPSLTAATLKALIEELCTITYTDVIDELNKTDKV